MKRSIHEMLYKWHRLLMQGNSRIADIGKYRAHPGPMQIVSGRLDRQIVSHLVCKFGVRRGGADCAVFEKANSLELFATKKMCKMPGAASPNLQTRWDAIDRQVYFEAPPSEKVHKEMTTFIRWFNSSETNESALARAAVAYIYFESIHPLNFSKEEC